MSFKLKNIDKNLETIFSKTTRLNENVFLVKTIWDEKKVMIVKWSRSHGQDGCHAKNTQNLLLQNHMANCLETWYVASWSVVLRSLYVLTLG